MHPLLFEHRPKRIVLNGVEGLLEIDQTHPYVSVPLIATFKYKRQAKQMVLRAVPWPVGCLVYRLASK